MIKFFKKVFNLILSFVLIFCCLFVNVENAEAKTLGDLKKELQKKEEEYKQNQENQKLTEDQMNTIKSNIESISQQIEENQNTIVKLDKEIENLKVSIEEKEQEIKKIVQFYQLSGGESEYLEYIFGAADFTDFIYRLAVSEQLTHYNENLIKEQNIMIENNNKKQKELAEQEKELLKKQENFNVQLDALGEEFGSFVEISVDIEEEIKTQKEAIELYEKQYGCKDSDEINECTKKQLPADTAFWRPMEKGRRTSEYGYRTYTLRGEVISGFHPAMDLSVSPSDNVPIYAAAAGKVVSIVRKSSCGGNKIFIHHNINGKTYTTSYVHLRKIMVSVGDTVTKDTQIGTMGGNPRIETWDTCTTGAHLHFSISTGLYLKDYSSWSTFTSRAVNPRSLVNFPSGGNYFYNRTTKY